MSENQSAKTDTSRPHYEAKPAKASTHAHNGALAGVTLVAFLTRFCGLDYPASVVFDETHPLRFTSWYLSGNYFFDVHPPLGRLFWVAIARAIGWQGGFAPDDPGDSYLAHQVPYVQLRIPAALLSTLVVPLVYSILRECGCGVPACLIAGGLIALDTAHIAHTRLIYVDGLLCFMILASMFSYIKFTKSRPWTRHWWTWLILQGFSLSCTISIKYVGIFTYATIGIFTFVELWTLWQASAFRISRSISSHILARALCLVLFPFGLYLLWFRFHFDLLPNSGYGDDFMSERFQSTLKNSAFASNGISEMSFWEKWLEVQPLIFKQNSVSGISLTPHPFELRPGQWPFPTRGVLFWCSNSSRGQIYFIGNAFGWWIALASLPLFVILSICVLYPGSRMFQPPHRRYIMQVQCFFFVMWTLHYLPFFTMKRSLMLHNYLPAHIASVMLTGSMAELVDMHAVRGALGKKPAIAAPTAASGKKLDDPEPEERKQKKEDALFMGSHKVTWTLCWLCLVPTFLFWWFWAPLTYGYPGLNPEAVNRKERIMGVLLYLGRNHVPSSCYD